MENNSKCYALTTSLGVRPCEQQESIRFWVWVEGMPIGLILTDSTRVQSQGLGTALAQGQGEGVFPKKSLQWTRELVIRGKDDVLVTI